ncbi:MAG: hypothetical protein AVDCRST_MAG48-1803, partial [uncultured Friedmanniella sp.]
DRPRDRRRGPDPAGGGRRRPPQRGQVDPG